MDTAVFFRQRKVVYILATFCCLLWGSSYPAIKSGYLLFAIAPTDIPSKMLFAGFRFFLSGIALQIIAALSGQNLWRFERQQWQQIGLLGLTQTTIQYIFFYIGLAYTTGVKGSIMNGTCVFFSVLLAHFIYHNDKLSRAKIIGCLIGFVGVMVVNLQPGALDFHFTLLGEGFVVIAAFILSASMIYGKKLSQTINTLVLTGHHLSFGGALLIALGFVFGGELTHWSWQAGAILGYLAFLSATAFTLWAMLLKYNRVGMISLFNFLNPIFGAGLSAAFLGESIMSLKNLAALLLVCGGIWLVSREEETQR